MWRGRRHHHTLDRWVDDIGWGPGGGRCLHRPRRLLIDCEVAFHRTGGTSGADDLADTGWNAIFLGFVFLGFDVLGFDVLAFDGEVMLTGGLGDDLHPEDRVDPVSGDDSHERLSPDTSTRWPPADTA